MCISTCMLPIYLQHNTDYKTFNLNPHYARQTTEIMEFTFPCYLSVCVCLSVLFHKKFSTDRACV